MFFSAATLFSSSFYSAPPSPSHLPAAYAAAPRLKRIPRRGGRKIVSPRLTFAPVNNGKYGRRKKCLAAKKYMLYGSAAYVCGRGMNLKWCRRRDGTADTSRAGAEAGMACAKVFFPRGPLRSFSCLLAAWHSFSPCDGQEEEEEEEDRADSTEKSLPSGERGGRGENTIDEEERRGERGLTHTQANRALFFSSSTAAKYERWSPPSLPPSLPAYGLPGPPPPRHSIPFLMVRSVSAAAKKKSRNLPPLSRRPLLGG